MCSRVSHKLDFGLRQQNVAEMVHVDAMMQYVQVYEFRADISTVHVILLVAAGSVYSTVTMQK